MRFGSSYGMMVAVPPVPMVPLGPRRAAMALGRPPREEKAPTYFTLPIPLLNSRVLGIYPNMGKQDKEPPARQRRERARTCTRTTAEKDLAIPPLPPPSRLSPRMIGHTNHTIPPSAYLPSPPQVSPARTPMGKHPAKKKSPSLRGMSSKICPHAHLQPNWMGFIPE